MARPGILDHKGTTDAPLNHRELHAHLDEICDWMASDPDATPVHFGRWGRDEMALVPAAYWQALQTDLTEALELVETHLA